MDYCAPGAPPLLELPRAPYEPDHQGRDPQREQGELLQRHVVRHEDRGRGHLDQIEIRGRDLLRLMAQIRTALVMGMLAAPSSCLSSPVTRKQNPGEPDALCPGCREWIPKVPKTSMSDDHATGTYLRLSTSRRWSSFIAILCPREPEHDLSGCAWVAPGACPGPPGLPCTNSPFSTRK